MQLLHKFKGSITKQTLALCLILVLSLGAMIYYGSQKEGYHIDELYSYGLANSEYLPFMHFGVSGYDVKDWMLEYGAGESLADLFRNLFRDFRILQECDFDWQSSEIYRKYLIAQANSSDTYTTTWVPGSDYQDYLQVSDSNTFNYASVYYNQRGDVHPPLFYLFLHTTCSIFRGGFSKWQGMVNNFLFLCLTLLVLFHMVKQYLGGREAAYGTLLAYFLSCGFLSTAVFLRMYALLTLTVVLCTDLHLALAARDYRLDRKLVRRLILSLLAGYMTQYYFVLFAIGLALVTCIRMILLRKWKPLLSYLLTLVGAAAIGIVLWPFSIKHVFQGYRGRQTLAALSSGDYYFIRLKIYGGHIFSQMFGGKAWIFFAAALLIALAALILRKGKLPYGKIALITVPVLIYLVLTSQIVPYLTDRYIMCLYPFFAIYLVCGCGYVFRTLAETFTGFPDRIRKLVPLAVGLALLLLNNAFLHTPNYLYPGGQETIPVPEHTTCVYVLPDGDWNESAEETLLLSKCDRVAVCYQSNLSLLAEGYQYTPGETLLIVVQKDLDVDAVEATLRDILQVPDLSETDRRIDANNTKIYLKG